MTRSADTRRVGLCAPLAGSALLLPWVLAAGPSPATGESVAVLLSLALGPALLMAGLWLRRHWWLRWALRAGGAPVQVQPLLWLKNMRSQSVLALTSPSGRTLFQQVMFDPVLDRVDPTFPAVAHGRFRSDKALVVEVDGVLLWPAAAATVDPPSGLVRRHPIHPQPPVRPAPTPPGPARSRGLLQRCPFLVDHAVATGRAAAAVAAGGLALGAPWTLCLVLLLASYGLGVGWWALSADDPAGVSELRRPLYVLPRPPATAAGSRVAAWWAGSHPRARK